jgi:SOS response regulatory protein OraA/RecX
MGLNARDLALKYLSRCDRTALEVKKHLGLKGISEEEIQDCLSYLSECGLIDDENYCDKYILYGMEKGRGPIRLERDLLEKGVSSDVIKLGLETHFGDGGEQKAARAYMNKLLRQIDRDLLGGTENLDCDEISEEDERPTLSEKEIAKIGRRLASQGYHSNVIYELLNKLRR